MSRRIVVDASVARAAGGTENPVSTKCREFLQAMLAVCHRVVMTPEIRREWRKHQSHFSQGWLAAMRSRRKVVSAAIDVERQEALLAAIGESRLGTRQRAAVEKDCLLVAAAWAADNLVASNDDKVRDLLATLTRTTPSVASLVWVNPTDPGGSPVRWLESGARSV
jgi:hypothetical protein